jgi:CBS domain-containing protein
MSSASWASRRARRSIEGNAMDEPISRIMSTDLVTADADDTVEQVAEAMRSGGLSCVPVVQGGGVIGIITTDNLLQLKAARRDPAQLHAWEICSYRPAEVAPSTPASEVARLMTERQIHHVIVTDNKDIKGVVSSLDFVRQFVRENGS